MSKSELIKRIIFTAVWCAVIAACLPVLVISPIKELSAKEPAVASLIDDNKVTSGHISAKTYPERMTKIIRHEQAGDNIGQYVKSSGRIMSARDTGKVTFLNLEKDYKKGLVLVIFASDYKRFREKPVSMYKGRDIEFEGRVKSYKGRPEIIIKSPDQITVIDADKTPF